MSMKILLIALLLFASCFNAFGKVKPTSKEKAEKKAAVEILQKYANASNITVAIEKQDEKMALGTKTISEGTIKYSAGKIYLVLNSDKKTELYFKNGKLTLVDYPDVDFDKDGIRKVTVVAKKTPAFLKSLINLFSDPKIFFSEFTIVESSISGDSLTLVLKPKSEDLKEFKLILDNQQKTIESVSFVDDVSTKTSIRFKNLNLKRKISKSTFEYKPQASDQVVTQ